jgi:hypothetical protein
VSAMFPPVADLGRALRVEWIPHPTPKSAAPWPLSGPPEWSM